METTKLQEQSRLFLKKPKLLNVGDYIPDAQVLDVHHKSRNIHEFLQDHLLLIFLSETCSACTDTLDVLLHFKEQLSQFNLAVIFDTDVETLTTVANAFDREEMFYLMNLDDMLEELGVYATPQGYALNRLGQVLASTTCNNAQDVQNLLWPFDLSLGGNRE